MSSRKPWTIVLLALAVSPAAAQAQTFPAKVVKIVVGVPAGGLQDQLARGIAQDLRAVWDQAVIVENRTGAAGIAATESVVNAAPDGHTILQMDNANILTNLILRASKLSYNFERDLTPVIALVSAKNILVASPKLAADSVPELVALARARPGVLNYGSFGIGSISHIDGEAIAMLAGIKVTHVPYKGGAPLLQALLADEVSFGLTGMTAAIPLIRDGKIKALAYVGLKRSPIFPDLPTLDESGFAGFDTNAWFGWWAPAGTPAAIVDKIAADVGRVTSAPAFADKYVLPLGHELVNAHGARVAERLDADKKIFVARTKPLDLKLDY